MSSFTAVSPTVLKVGAGVLCVAVCAAAVWLWLLYAAGTGGTAYATVTDDGIARAVTIDLSTQTLADASVMQDLNVLVIAAVPNPQGDAVAFLTRTRGSPRTLSIARPDGSQPVTVFTGDVEVPAWSKDGGSVAFAVREGAVGDTPEAWIVHRAVKSSGSSLAVGVGYRPYPSAGQETFALSSSGVAALSFSDTQPSIIVASPVPVSTATAFAVSPDGKRVAWIAPADHSLQVFERTSDRFVPVLLATSTLLQSMVFSPDGEYLLGAVYAETMTSLFTIAVTDGKVQKVGEYPGLIKLHAWRYEQ